MAMFNERTINFIVEKGMEIANRHKIGDLMILYFDPAHLCLRNAVEGYTSNGPGAAASLKKMKPFEVKIKFDNFDELFCKIEYHLVYFMTQGKVCN